VSATTNSTIIAAVAAPAGGSFDYAALPAELQERLRNQAFHIKAAMKSTVSAIIEIGRDLIAVQQHLEHGQFSDWVEAECGFSIRSGRGPHHDPETGEIADAVPEDIAA
jgi:hypothetical protein